MKETIGKDERSKEKGIKEGKRKNEGNKREKGGW